MTIPRLIGFNRYWATHPPVHISAARIYSALTGYTPPPMATGQEPEEVKTLEDFIADFMAEGGQIEVTNG